MSSDVILYCEQLKSAFGNNDTKKVSTNLDAIGHHFDDRISENEIGKILNGLKKFILFFHQNS